MFNACYRAIESSILPLIHNTHHGRMQIRSFFLEQADRLTAHRYFAEGDLEMFGSVPEYFVVVRIASPSELCGSPFKIAVQPN